jgi:hypothetical protein
MNVLSRKERYNLALNVAAKFGMDGDLTAEYAKALAMFESIPDMVAKPIPPMPQNNAVQPQVGTEPTTSPPMDESGANGSQMA